MYCPFCLQRGRKAEILLCGSVIHRCTRCLKDIEKQERQVERVPISLGRRERVVIYYMQKEGKI